MNPFLQALASGKTLVADGATGTNLQSTGLTTGIHTEDWLYEHPDLIQALQRGFVEAGSQIILTCTFGGTSIRMEGSQYAGQIEALNERAARLAREIVVGHEVLVGGSIGPLGKLLRPYGPIAYEQAVDAFAEQVRGLSDGGVDLLVIETHFSLEEARAALEAARRHASLPTVVSFSFDRGTRTMMGVRPSDVARTFVDLGADMIGVNCGTSLENAMAVIQDYASAAPGFPIWAKPNAGLPRMQAGLGVYDVRPERMADFAHTAVSLGARVVGGCCGSTTAHVKAIADGVGQTRAAPTH